MTAFLKAANEVREKGQFSFLGLVLDNAGVEWTHEDVNVRG
jgi:hypothetical protein